MSRTLNAIGEQLDELIIALQDEELNDDEIQSLWIKVQTIEMVLRSKIAPLIIEVEEEQ